MRFIYSAQAFSAQSGSRALIATTWSRGTRLTFVLGVRVHAHALAAPDFLEVVEAAHGGMHDMHDHVAEIDEHPFPCRLALNAVDANAHLANLLLHAVGERLDLTGRIAARDDDALEHRRHARCIEHQDVVSLDVFERVDDNAL